MARRWTPQRMTRLRRIRIIGCAALVAAVFASMFVFTARKTVALTVNGESSTVTTYALTATRLLEEQHVDVKTHDIVSVSSGDRLANHSVVSVQSAYQTTITIDGKDVLFWTTATSAAQLLGFFEENEANAAKITVNVSNVYSQLTGGIVINEDGPVTVIADGTSSVAPNGKLPAASILDSKGITVGKDDRVSVEKNGDETILRVQRVTYGEETRDVDIPFSTRTITDDSLAEEQTEVRQAGKNGKKQQTVRITYVDGKAESETVLSEKTLEASVDEIIAVGSKKAADSANTADQTNTNTANTDGTTNSSQSESNTSTETNNQTSGNTNQGNTTSDTAGNGSHTDSNAGSTTTDSNQGTTGDQSGTSDTNGDQSGTSDTNSGGTNDQNTGNTDNSGGTNDQNNGNTGDNSDSNGNTDGSSTGRLWHPTVAQAQAYAAGAAAQRGWTGNDWECLKKLWTRESSWLWYAENPYSLAYGIPQALPASKMAEFGANYRDDAAVQIDWGLSYIAQRYGSPSQAWAHSEAVGWY